MYSLSYPFSIFAGLEIFMNSPDVQDQPGLGVDRLPLLLNYTHGHKRLGRVGKNSSNRGLGWVGLTFVQFGPTTIWPRVPGSISGIEDRAGCGRRLGPHRGRFEGRRANFRRGRKVYGPTFKFLFYVSSIQTKMITIQALGLKVKQQTEKIPERLDCLRKIK